MDRFDESLNTRSDSDCRTFAFILINAGGSVEDAVVSVTGILVFTEVESAIASMDSLATVLVSSNTLIVDSSMVDACSVASIDSAIDDVVTKGESVADAGSVEERIDISVVIISGDTPSDSFESSVLKVVVNIVPPSDADELSDTVSIFDTTDVVEEGSVAEDLLSAVDEDVVEPARTPVSITLDSETELIGLNSDDVNTESSTTSILWSVIKELEVADDIDVSIVTLSRDDDIFGVVTGRKTADDRDELSPAEAIELLNFMEIVGVERVAISDANASSEVVLAAAIEVDRIGVSVAEVSSSALIGVLCGKEARDPLIVGDTLVVVRIDESAATVVA